MRDERIKLGDVAKNTHCINRRATGLLQRSTTKFGQWRLRRDYQHRNFVSKRGGHTGDQIGSAGPGGTAHDAHFSRLAIISVSHKSSATFVSRNHQARAAPTLTLSERI